MIRGLIFWISSQPKPIFFIVDGPEILDDHVGDPDQLPEDLPPLLQFQVEDQALLVAVQADEIAAAVLAGLAGKGAVFPRIVPLRRFEMDHLGAEIGQKHRRRRCGQDVAQIDDPDSFQSPLQKRPLLIYDPTVVSPATGGIL